MESLARCLPRAAKDGSGRTESCRQEEAWRAGVPFDIGEMLMLTLAFIRAREETSEVIPLSTCSLRWEVFCGAVGGVTGAGERELSGSDGLSALGDVFRVETEPSESSCLLATEVALIRGEMMGSRDALDALGRRMRGSIFDFRCGGRETPQIISDAVELSGREVEAASGISASSTPVEARSPAVEP